MDGVPDRIEIHYAEYIHAPFRRESTREETRVTSSGWERERRKERIWRNTPKQVATVLVM